MYTAVEKKNRGVQFEWVLVECWWDLYNLLILYSETMWDLYYVTTWCFSSLLFSPKKIGQMIQVDYVEHIFPGWNHGRRHHHHQWALSWTDQFERNIESPKLSHHSISEESCVRIDVVSRVVRHDTYHSFSRMGSHCTIEILASYFTILFVQKYIVASDSLCKHSTVPEMLVARWLLVDGWCWLMWPSWSSCIWPSCLGVDDHLKGENFPKINGELFWFLTGIKLRLTEILIYRV